MSVQGSFRIKPSMRYRGVLAPRAGEKVRVIAHPPMEIARLAELIPKYAKAVMSKNDYRGSDSRVTDLAGKLLVNIVWDHVAEKDRYHRYSILTPAYLNVVRAFEDKREDPSSLAMGSRVEIKYDSGVRVDPMGVRFDAARLYVGTVLTSNETHLVLSTAYGVRRFLVSKIRAARYTVDRPEDGVAVDFLVSENCERMSYTITPLADLPNEKVEDEGYFDEESIALPNAVISSIPEEKRKQPSERGGFTVGVDAEGKLLDLLGHRLRLFDENEKTKALLLLVDVTWSEDGVITLNGNEQLSFRLGDQITYELLTGSKSWLG